MKLEKTIKKCDFTGGVIYAARIFLPQKGGKMPVFGMENISIYGKNYAKNSRVMRARDLIAKKMSRNEKNMN